MSSEEHFEALFAADADPWGYDYRWYEQRKRNLLLASLPRLRYANAYEPACGNGALTELLALRCDALQASDASESAVALTRARLAYLPRVRIARQSVPGGWPQADPDFDLIVLSEIGYYLQSAALDGLAARVRDTLAADGTLVACHWRHPTDDRLHSAEHVHAVLAEALQLAPAIHHEEKDFLLDLWTVDTRSVAQMEGLA